MIGAGFVKISDIDRFKFINPGIIKKSSIKSDMDFFVGPGIITTLETCVGEATVRHHGMEVKHGLGGMGAATTPLMR